MEKSTVYEVNLLLFLFHSAFQKMTIAFLIIIMIEIQGKGTACKPDWYIIRSNKIN